MLQRTCSNLETGLECALPPDSTMPTCEANSLISESEAQTTSPARQALTTAHSAISPSSDLGTFQTNRMVVKIWTH